jgi:hypothetical protein
MMGVAIATVLVFVVIVGMAMYVVREHVRKRERVDEELHDARTPTLEYDVPTGQDPAVPLAALEREGYTATVDIQAVRPILLVKCPEGLEVEREHVRSVIESANVTAPDDGIPLEVEVRFRDEA